jgi:hypothetical protein
MGVTDVGNLALLGLVAERPRPADELVGAVKLVGGDRFTPTAAFIEGRVAHLVEPAAGLWSFCTTLKLSLLDLVGAECRHEAVATLLDGGRRRASALEMAQWTGCCGPVMERCLALEQARDALALRWMQDAMAAAAMGERIDEK